MNRYQQLKKNLNLNYDPVGLRLIFNSFPDGVNKQRFTNIYKPQRFSKYLKRAALGEFLKIGDSDTLCLKSKPRENNKKFENIELDMRLDIRGLNYILLFPINKYEIEYVDALILIVNPLNCMRIINAYVELYNKPLKPMVGTSAGVCSEIVAYVIKRDDINFSFLCNGARKYAGFGENDIICGIPTKMINEILPKIIQI